jgi:iron(III) transport system ATP-binding protein
MFGGRLLLQVSDLQKAFVSISGTLRAVRDVSFVVQTGQFFTLLGPSGCGKTTTLHCIAGLQTPDAGEILMDDSVLYSSQRGIDMPASQRDIGMVFQSYAIWPHMTVFENVAFPLVYGRRRPPREEVRSRVSRVLSLVKLDGLADRAAPFLSGGQQQRVALARALVHEPPLLVLDEPLSNLDAKLRDQMRVELRELIMSLGMTTVYVTHDQIEALAMSDRIVLMRDGRIVQEGEPRDIYFHPNDAFVAEFLGSSNILRGRLIGYAPDRRRGIVETPLGRFGCVPACGMVVGAAADLVIRPEGFQLCDATTAADAPNLVLAQVETVTFNGGSVEAKVRVKDRQLRVKLDSFADIRPQGMLRLEVLADRCAAVPAEEQQQT